MSSSLRKFSYDVFIQLGTLSLATKFPCKVGTIWQSFMKSIQAESKPDLVNGNSYLSQTLMDRISMELDISRNIFNPKMSVIKVLLYTEKGVREAGQVEFDMAGVLSRGLAETTMELKLEKCPDVNARISFTIKMIPRGEVRNQVSFVEGLVSDIPTRAAGNQSPQKQRSEPHLPQPQAHSAQQIQLPHMPIIVPQIVSAGPPSSLLAAKNRNPVPLTPPNIQIQITPPPPLTTPLQNYKNERDALLLQNAGMHSHLKEAEQQNHALKNQLMKALSQKQTLYTQLQGFNLQMHSLRLRNEQLCQFEHMYRQAEEQLVIARTQLAKIFNASTELGGLILTDKLQTAIGIQQQQTQQPHAIEQHQPQYYQLYQQQQL